MNFLILGKNFLKGFVKTLDMSGTKEWPNTSNSMMHDYFSLKSDWESIGCSFKYVLPDSDNTKSDI